MKDADFTKLRKRIARSDRALLQVLSKRFDSALEIGKRKAKLGIPVVQKGRFREVLKEWVERGQALGLEARFVRELYHLIHDESVRVQKKVGKK